MIGWVFFASQGMHEAIAYLGNMFLLHAHPFMDVTAMSILTNYGVYFLIAAIGCTPFLKNALKGIQVALKDQMWYVKPIVTACFFFILISYLLSNTYQAFLYFKF